MDASASKMGLGGVSSNVSRHNPFSKLKTYGFIIAIIMGIAGLAVGATGLSGYFHGGALSNMAQLDAIIMMAAGGGSGVILLIIGITGVVKNCKSIGHPKIPLTPPAVSISSTSLSFSSSTTPSSISRYPAIQAALPTIQIGMINIIGDYAGEVLYGPEAWGKWGVEVLDAVPPAPKVDLSKNDKVLLYIPQRIRFNGKEQNLTLKVLKEIAGDSFGYLSFGAERLCEGSPAPGWILIDKDVIPESRGANYISQKKMAEERGGSLPTALEAATLNLMVFAFTGERLYGEETYTRCLENIEEEEDDYESYVIVGGFNFYGFRVYCNSFQEIRFGIACVQRQF